MSFASREESRIAGHPIHLYKFRFGPAEVDVERYTNIRAGFTLPSELDALGAPAFYKPLTIEHGEIVSSGNLDKSTLPVRMPDIAEVALLYKDGTPSHVVTLIIREGHLADDDFKVCFSGRVLGTTFQDDEATLDCEPITASLRRSGLTRDYQYACPLVLYGPQCRANRAAATSVVAVSIVNGPLLTLPEGWAPEARKDKYLGGIAEWVGEGGRTERRGIVRRVGNVLTLDGEARGLTAGEALTLVLGCNHQHGITDPDGDCKNLHDNILNFGGQHQIPTKNPIGITNPYY